jgi:hypothetical protein
MYDIFGKYGAIRQIRLGNATGTKVSHRHAAAAFSLTIPAELRPRRVTAHVQGTAFVVYEDIYDAKNA